jgi:hypothetical protein
MPDNQSMLKQLAENRARRMVGHARPSFKLTADEIKQSTETAMRLADAQPDLPSMPPPRAA